MKPFETAISRLTTSPLATIVLLLASLLILWSGSQFTPLEQTPQIGGLLSDRSVFGIDSSWLCALVATGVMALIVSVVQLVNRTFNILRTNSSLCVGLTMLLCASMPGALGLQITGLMLCGVLILALTVMYTAYHRRQANRRIFLVFALLSFGACYQWVFAMFVPIMFVATAQMRCLNFRSILAALLGIITPIWILWGFDIFPLLKVNPLQIDWIDVDTLSQMPPRELVALCGMSVFALLTTLINTIGVFGLNAQTRAFNGILATFTLWILISMIADCGHFEVYMASLATFTAMQLTLLQSLYQRRRAYIAVGCAVVFCLLVIAL